MRLKDLLYFCQDHHTCSHLPPELRVWSHRFSDQLKAILDGLGYIFCKYHFVVNEIPVFQKSLIYRLYFPAKRGLNLVLKTRSIAMDFELLFDEELARSKLIEDFAL